MRRVDRSSAPDPMVNTEAPDYGHNSAKRVGGARNRRHLVHRKAARLDKVRRQPSQDKKETVVATKKANRGTPQRSLTQDRLKWWYVRGSCALACRRFMHLHP